MNYQCSEWIEVHLHTKLPTRRMSWTIAMITWIDCLSCSVQHFNPSDMWLLLWYADMLVLYPDYRVGTQGCNPSSIQTDNPVEVCWRYTIGGYTTWYNMKTTPNCYALCPLNSIPNATWIFKAMLNITRHATLKSYLPEILDSLLWYLCPGKNCTEWLPAGNITSQIVFLFLVSGWHSCFSMFWHSKRLRVIHRIKVHSRQKTGSTHLVAKLCHGWHSFDQC